MHTPAVYIRRTGAFGDVLWTEPLVRYFADRAIVTIVTAHPEVFNNYPNPNLWIIPTSVKPLSKGQSFEQFLKLKGIQIDLDMAYENNPNMHILEAYRIAAGIPEMKLTNPQIYLSEEEKKPFCDDNYVVLHIESSPHNFRRVYGVDWQEIVRYLQKQGKRVLQISKYENDLYGEWVKTKDFREVMSLIYHCKLFIGVDSGPSHIAASFGIPSILFFGSVNPAYRQLEGFKGQFLQSGCEFAHCYHETKGHTGEIPCRLVGRMGIPKCCIHTTEKVIEAIDEINKRCF